MNPHLTIRLKALLDLADAYEWYESKRAGLGRDLEAEVYKVIELIVDRPHGFAIVHEDSIRHARVDRFPYVVYFIEDAGHVAVIAVLHNRRDIGRALKGRT